LAATFDISTKEGRQNKSLYIHGLCVGSDASKKHDLECWDMYNEQHDDSEFDYLRKTKDGDIVYEMPAQIRNIGRQRPKINNLVSQQLDRPFIYSVYTIDRKSLKQKYDDISKKWIEKIFDRISERYVNTTLQIIGIDTQLQKMEQYAQQVQQTDPAQAEQIQSMIPVLSVQLGQVKSKLQREQVYSEKELKEIERYFAYDYRTLEEELAQKLSVYLYDILDIKNKSISNWISQTVTGKQYYMVDYIPGDKNPVFKDLNGMGVYYPSINSIRWVQDGPWCAYEELWSVEDTLKEYGRYLKQTQIDELKAGVNQQSIETGNFKPTPSGGAILINDDKSPYGGTLIKDHSKLVRVFKLWYKEDRTIRSKKSPNPYKPGEYFTHYIDANKKVINAGEYNYRNGKYISKTDKTIEYPKGEVELINSDKGEYINDRYILDRYHTVILNGKHILDFGLDPIQPRSIDDYYNVKLPIVGKTYSAITEKPYSLLWSTKDLQKLYKIIHYHRELLLAISGTKGNVIDKSQKPKGMSQKEWEYNMKLGRLYIETTDNLGRKVNNSFNQWPSYDNTMTQSIQYLDIILDNIDNEISDTMGIPRQQMGKVVNTDQVGTYAMAQQQGLLTLQILHYDHDLVLAKAMTQLMNIAAAYCYEEDELLNIMNPSIGRQLIKLPAGLLKNKTWDVVLYNSDKDNRRLNELKQLAIKQNDKGMLPFSSLIQVWTEDTLTALRNKIEYFNEQAEQMQQMAAQNDEESKMRLLEAQMKFKAEMDQWALQQKQQIEEKKLAIEEARAKQEQLRDMMNNENQRLQREQDGMLKGAEIASENQIEMGYLKNQDKHSTIDQQLKSIEMQLNYILQNKQLAMDTGDRVNTHMENLQKLVIENKKTDAAKAKAKEHIKD